jgi:hypothetical protein
MALMDSICRRWSSPNLLKHFEVTGQTTEGSEMFIDWQAMHITADKILPLGWAAPSTAVFCHPGFAEDVLDCCFVISVQVCLELPYYLN